MQPLINIKKYTSKCLQNTNSPTESKTAKTTCDSSITILSFVIVWEYFHDSVTVSDSEVYTMIFYYHESNYRERLS